MSSLLPANGGNSQLDGEQVAGLTQLFEKLAWSQVHLFLCPKGPETAVRRARVDALFDGFERRWPKAETKRGPAAARRRAWDVQKEASMIACPNGEAAQFAEFEALAKQVDTALKKARL